MTQPDHTPRRRCAARPEATRRLHPPGERTRRGGERRPYPTASTTTRVSPAKPGSAACPQVALARHGVHADPGDGVDGRPGSDRAGRGLADPIVEKIVGAFSEPGGRVALLPWPSAQPALVTVRGSRRSFSDGVLDHAPGAEPDGEVADALAAVEGLRRTVRVVRVPVDPRSPVRGRDRSGPILSAPPTARPRRSPRRRVQTCAAGCSTARRPRHRTPT